VILQGSCAFFQELKALQAEQSRHGVPDAVKVAHSEGVRASQRKGETEIDLRG
jgi:hypothetical protein